MQRPADPAPAAADSSWSSSGLRRPEAIRQWQDWAARTIAPIDVTVRDGKSFAARWRSQSIGQLHFLELAAPAQRVVHRGTGSGSGKAAPAIQLIYARSGALRTHAGQTSFTVQPGEFVLLDNTRFYQMEMDTSHEAVDLLMPRAWLERWLPDPEPLLARPISARSGWGGPLGSLIETIACGIDDSPLPRPMIAEQVGGLLMLAAGIGEAAPSRHRSHLTQRILRRIDSDFADPDLCAEGLCRDLGISKRYLQVLLAAQGTSFVQELTATRLERASAMLADPRGGTIPIGEVAFRCGFLDAGYFARQFRKRFAVTPGQYRRGLAAS
jgi:AraC-like DNA-binding protein